MGKHKKSKNQQKKAAMVQQTIREALIYGANKVNADAYVGEGTLIPLEALTYCCNNEIYHISACSSSESLSKEDKSDIFSLVETNLKPLYEASKGDMPWEPKEKYSELFHSTSRMLLVHRTTETAAPDSGSTGGSRGEFVGFTHFRFEEDDEDEPQDAVLYLYEIQLDAKLQRCGLGSHLMRLVELVARQFHMPKIMLTVFKHNSLALQFYTNKLKYAIDESSPSKFGDSKCTYEILSKVLFELPPEQLKVLSAVCVKKAQRTIPKQETTVSLPTPVPPAAAAPAPTLVVTPLVPVPVPTAAAKAPIEVVSKSMEKENISDIKSDEKEVQDEKEEDDDEDDDDDDGEEDGAEEDDDDEEEEGFGDESMNLLVEVARVFNEQHGRMPTMEEIKESLRTIQSAQQENGGESLTDKVLQQESEVVSSSKPIDLSN